jgi:hypothetical protein
MWHCVCHHIALMLLGALLAQMFKAIQHRAWQEHPPLWQRATPLSSVVQIARTAHERLAASSFICIML